MAQTSTPAPAGRPGQDEDREQRIAALRIRLHETAGQIRSAEDWTRYLQAAARLHGETWANVLLISSRIPDATLVRGYEAWRAAGRQVNRDEKGIEIFSGMRRQEPDGRGAEEAGQDHSWRDARRVAYVWDLSQTTGQPVPLPPAFPAPAGEAPPGLWDCLCWLARREGFAVEREDGSPGDGTTFWAARRIRIPPGLPSGQAAWALAHQLGHVLRAQHHCPPAGHYNLRLSRHPESRSRLRSVHHLRPVRRPGRARLLQPADVGGHRSACPARSRHPDRRRARHHGCGENQPPAGPLPGRQPPGRTAGSRNQQRQHAMTNAAAARRIPGHRAAIGSGARSADLWRPGRRHAVLRRPARP